MKCILLVLTTAVAVVLGINEQCRETHENYQQCIRRDTLAAAQAPEDFNGEQAKRGVFKCMVDNGCLPKSMETALDAVFNKKEERGPPKEREPTETERCIQALLGKSKQEAVQECVAVEFPDLPIPEDDVENSKKKLMEEFVKGMEDPITIIYGVFHAQKGDAWLSRICPNADAARTCMKEVMGFDHLAADKEAIREALCSAADSCETEELQQCKADFQRVAQTACECQQSVDDQIEEDGNCVAKPKGLFGGRFGSKLMSFASNLRNRMAEEKPDCAESTAALVNNRPTDKFCGPDFSWNRSMYKM